MRIEQGFGRFEQGEQLIVKLLSIGYTKKNHRPYARVLAEGGEKAFNVNIADKDRNLQAGRYKIICTNVNENGYGYVNFKRLQDSCWDIHDKARGDYEGVMDEVANELNLDGLMKNNSKTNTEVPLEEKPKAVKEAQLSRIKEAIELTNEFRHKLPEYWNNMETNRLILKILDELYKDYGFISLRSEEYE